jgi:hypothetical protein
VVAGVLAEKVLLVVNIHLFAKIVLVVTVEMVDAAEMVAPVDTEALVAEVHLRYGL